MSDAEWDAWQAHWTGAAGPLPDVRARARREARAHRLAAVAFFALVATALAGSQQAFAAPEPEVHAIGWMIVAFAAAMGLGYAWIRRGISPRRIGTPREALAFMQQRLRLEHLAAHLVRWTYAGLCAAFVVLFPRVAAPHSAPKLEMSIAFPFMALLFAATFSAPWWVARRNRRHRQELDRWRKWMDEQHL
jgi:hypothetical protein